MAPILLDAGHEVVGLDSDLFQGCTFTPGIRPVPELRLDLRDVEQQHLKGFDAVVHLAALSNDSLSNLNPEVTYDINHAASVRLAQLAKDAGVRRFLFSSSCSVYGTPTATVLPRRPGSIRSLRTASRKSASNRT